MHANDPLQPPPRWSHTPGAGWHDASALVTGSRVEHPPSFVQGYEQGAYALAAYLYARLQWDGERGLENVVATLRAYHRGSERPVKGWEHEPKRS